MGCGGPGLRTSGRILAGGGPRTWLGGAPPVGRSAKVLKTAVILIWNWTYTEIGLQQVLISAAKRKITEKILAPKNFEEVIYNI